MHKHDVSAPYDVQYDQNGKLFDPFKAHAEAKEVRPGSAKAVSDYFLSTLRDYRPSGVKSGGTATPKPAQHPYKSSGPYRNLHNYESSWAEEKQLEEQAQKRRDFYNTEYSLRNKAVPKADYDKGSPKTDCVWVDPPTKEEESFDPVVQSRKSRPQGQYDRQWTGTFDPIKGEFVDAAAAAAYERISPDHKPAAWTPEGDTALSGLPTQKGAMVARLHQGVYDPINHHWKSPPARTADHTINREYKSPDQGGGRKHLPFQRQNESLGSKFNPITQQWEASPVHSSVDYKREAELIRTSINNFTAETHTPSAGSSPPRRMPGSPPRSRSNSATSQRHSNASPPHTRTNSGPASPRSPHRRRNPHF